MMFAHIFAYRLKCLIRNKRLVFSTLLFPMVLATLFALAFSNLSSGDAFTSIPVAVVNNAEYQSDAAFQSALKSVSDDNNTASEKLFHVTFVTLDQAGQDLMDNKITGYILFDKGAHVVVRDSGFSQTILKEFIDGYLQEHSAYSTIVSINPSAAKSFQTPGVSAYLKDVAPGKATSNKTMTYFYALIAMASLFGGYWGNKEITDIQADLSPQGARLNLAPIHKMKAFGYSIFAAITEQFLSLVLLVAYLGLVLKVDFGGQLLYVLMACLAGSFTGVSFGAFIGALTGKNERRKTALLASVSMAMSFLSGLMVPSIKYTVTHAVPLMAYINPANLISDAFYSLYYYSTYTRFFTNIGLLFGMSAIFYLVVYFITRRQRYASL